MKLFLIAVLVIALLVAANFLFASLFGWVGALGVTTIFTLICLYYFYQNMRLLSAIQSMPEGKTVHAEYFYRHITEGMSLIKITQIAQALGQKISSSPVIYAWEDNQHRVTVAFENDKAVKIELSTLN